MRPPMKGQKCKVCNVAYKDHNKKIFHPTAGWHLWTAPSPGQEQQRKSQDRSRRKSSY